MDQKVAIPDEILRQQVCFECYQYLSVFPVVINKKGDKMCGRCIPKSDAQIRETRNLHIDSNSTVHSTYNLISQKFLYKCVNHFEGCEALLTVHETLDHEAQCVNMKRGNNCFFCSFYGNLCQIVFHCSQIHKENITWDGSFELNLETCEFSKEFIFVENNDVFLITISTSSDKVLNIAITSKGTQKCLEKLYAIRFWVPIGPCGSEVDCSDYGLFDTKYETCFKKPLEEFYYHFGNARTIKCQVLLNQVVFADKEIEFDKRCRNLRIRERDLMLEQKKLEDGLIKLEANKTHLINDRKNLDTVIENKRQEFENLWRNRKKEIDAENKSLDSCKDLLKTLSYDFFRCMGCQKITTESVNFCIKQHCYCSNCLVSNCIKCDKMSEFSPLTQFNNILVKCDWPRCIENINFSNYITHKRNCQMRPYNCPLNECKDILYSSNALLEHWHCKMPNLITTNELICDKYGIYEFYWLIRNDVYHMLVEFLEGIIEILIEDINVLPNNNLFFFKGRCSINLRWGKAIEFTNFCGKYKFSGQKSSFSKIQISTLNLT